MQIRGVMDEYNSLEDDEKANFDISKLGENITFHGYFTDANGNKFQDSDEPTDLSKAFTKSSFKFDGYDDYITFPYDNSTNFESGFTFEFYGVVTGNISHWNTSEIDVETGYYKSVSEAYAGLLSIASTGFGSPSLRCGIYRYDVDRASQIHYNWSWFYGDPFDDWTSPSWPYNHYIDIRSFKLLFNTPIYYSFVINPKKNLQQIFINGEKKMEGYLNDVPYTQFCDSLKNSNTELEVYLGTCSMSNEDWWHFPEMECYSMKLYNVPLSEDGVSKNYEATIKYHQFLESGSSGTTNGNTGGTDF